MYALKILNFNYSKWLKVILHKPKSNNHLIIFKATLISKMKSLMNFNLFLVTYKDFRHLENTKKLLRQITF